MPAIFHRLGAQTLELCNGIRVNAYEIADSSVVVEKRLLVPVGRFLVLWVSIWVIVAGAFGVFEPSRDSEATIDGAWAGF